MARIACPACGKPTSDKSDHCIQCKTPLKNISPERAAELGRSKVRNTYNNFMNQSFVALLAFLGGITYFYWQTPEPGTLENSITLGLIGGGSAWYVICRIIMFIQKSRLK